MCRPAFHAIGQQLVGLGLGLYKLDLGVSDGNGGHPLPQNSGHPKICPQILPACNGMPRNTTDAKKAGTLDFSGLTGLLWTFSTRHCRGAPRGYERKKSLCAAKIRLCRSGCQTQPLLFQRQADDGKMCVWGGKRQGGCLPDVWSYGGDVPASEPTTLSTISA